jgi:hypothetical protein
LFAGDEEKRMNPSMRWVKREVVMEERKGGEAVGSEDMQARGEDEAEKRRKK